MSVAALDAFPERLRLPAQAAGTRVWWSLAVVLVVLFALTFGAYLADDRLLNGVSVWIKPLKFQASLALHFATLAILARLLSPARLRSRGFRVVATASTAAALFEISWIMLQAARGRASHFNEQTLLESVMYELMGLGAVVLVAALLILGLWLVRDHPHRLRVDPLRLGAVLGLILAAVCTLAVAGYMSSHGGHLVGAVTADASGLPVFGWSRQAGDLRVAHFVATHALQVLPLAGLMLRDAGARGCRWVLAGSGAYFLFTASVFLQALGGQPFLDLSVY